MPVFILSQYLQKKVITVKRAFINEDSPIGYLEKQEIFKIQ